MSVEFIVTWSVDYSFRGQGLTEGVRTYDTERKALDFIERGIEANPPLDETVYPNNRTVIKHHPGFEAVLYRAEVIHDFTKVHRPAEQM